MLFSFPWHRSASETVFPRPACGYRESAWVSGIQCISCPRLYGRYRKSGTRRFRLGNGVFLTSPLISAACGIHLYDGDSLCDPAGVILQTDEGKRIFKMTPIHHHFELMGWSETQIVTVFATITAILCLIALMGL